MDSDFVLIGNPHSEAKRTGDMNAQEKRKPRRIPHCKQSARGGLSPTHATTHKGIRFNKLPHSLFEEPSDPKSLKVLLLYLNRRLDSIQWDIDRIDGVINVIVDCLSGEE